MFNWLRSLFQKKKIETPVFSRVFIKNNPWNIEAWQGVLEKTGYSYLISLNHLRPIRSQEIQPHKYFPQATHQIIILYYLPQNNGKPLGKFVYNRHINLGHWRLENYQTEIQQWQDPDNYKLIITSMDDCGRSILRRLLIDLENCDDSLLLRHSKLSDNYWNITIANHARSCPGITKKIGQTISVASNGISVWLTDSDDFSTS